MCLCLCVCVCVYVCVCVCVCMCTKLIFGLHITRDCMSCSSWKPKLLACLTTNYTACLQPTADQALLEQLAETMLAVIKALYYICSSPPDTPDIRSLPGQITGIINCSQSFFTNLSSCLRNKTSEKADKCR